MSIEKNGINYEEVSSCPSFSRYAIVNGLKTDREKSLTFSSSKHLKTLRP